MRSMRMPGIMVCLLVISAAATTAQGRFDQPPDIPIGVYGGYYGSNIPYGWGDYVYGTPWGYAPPMAARDPSEYYTDPPLAGAEPWNPQMRYDPRTGYWHPPDGGVPRRYDRSVVRVFEPRYGGTIYIPREVYEEGVWRETPRFIFR